MNQGFRSITDRLADEKRLRLNAIERKLPYGVHYLDRALGGILPTDLQLIGAGSGAGKTELAVHIALTNARLGKQVYYFALEGEENEIERRQKYKLMADLCYKDLAPHEPNISFQDWYYGEVDLSKYEAAAEEQLRAYSTLHTFYRKQTFGIAELAMEYSALSGADLVILDHLHYIDLDDDAENVAMKKLTKALKDMTEIMRVPCIAIAHLRKLGKVLQKTVLPDLSDFHGTSDITKICTKAILLSHAGMEGDVGMTYMQAAKNRHGGARTKVVAKVGFNTRLNSYTEIAGFYTSMDGELKPLDGVPSWY